MRNLIESLQYIADLVITSAIKGSSKKIFKSQVLNLLKVDNG